MLFLRNILNLTYCSFYFSNVNSCLYLRGLFGLLIVRLPSFYFIKKNFLSVSLMFLNRFFFISVYRHLRYLYKRLFNFSFVRLRLKGLGYRVRRITKFFYRFFFNFTNFFYLHVPSTFIVSIKKKRLLLISFDLSLLHKVLAHLLLLKKLSVYRIRGLVYPRQIVFLKIGKKKL